MYFTLTNIFIFFSNQWRESHIGDTNVCPETSADPWHVDPLALPRPDAWPSQGRAPFWTISHAQTAGRASVMALQGIFSSILLLPQTPAAASVTTAELCSAISNCSPQSASAYCTTLTGKPLQCWLSQQGSLSSYCFCSYFSWVFFHLSPFTLALTQLILNCFHCCF